MIFRKAVAADIEAVSGIYEPVHEAESRGELTIGWARGVYPVRETAQGALKRDDLFVAVEEGKILASAVINRLQVDVYEGADWEYPARDEEVMVLHTLTVSPKHNGTGVGRNFVAYYENYAKEQGCTVLRMDTNERNVKARRLYNRLGYREAGKIP